MAGTGQQRAAGECCSGGGLPGIACCTLSPSPPSASSSLLAAALTAAAAAPGGLRCRFAKAEVPAWRAPDGTVCCQPPADVDAEDGSAECFAVVDTATGAELFKSAAARAREEQERQQEKEGGRKAGAIAAGAPAAADHNGDDGRDFGRRQGESRADYLKREYSALRPFVIISLSYLLFTTTDGAVRMIVLLHAYNLGFSAMLCAVMFSMYELAGVATNLCAGMMGARWGIKWTLLSGLGLQLAGIAMLFGWQARWAAPGEQWRGVVFVTLAQMLCGVAKDLTKLGGKTVTKLVTPDERQSRLFKIVSLVTGWKNSMKGVGYFIGAACLTYNYYFALGVLLALIFAAIPWAVVGLDRRLGRARKENVTWRAILQQRRNVNVLSAARFFLFGSRDLWFEVPLPYFLRDAAYGLGWPRVAVGAILAAFIIGYGQVQSWTPQLVLGPLRQSPANKYVELLWGAVLALAPAYLAGVTLGAPAFYPLREVPAMAGALLGGLALYCVLFAVNSSIHSYLIVRYSEGDKVAMNVGFYYCANALGRLTGTLASGAIYTYAGRGNFVYGLGWCFVASVAFALVAAAITAFIRDDVGGLRCGPCLTLVPAPAPRPPAQQQAAGGGGDGEGGNNGNKGCCPAPPAAGTGGACCGPPPVAAPPSRGGAAAAATAAAAAAAAAVTTTAPTTAAVAATTDSSSKGELDRVVAALLSDALDPLPPPPAAGPGAGGRRVLFRADLNLPVRNGVVTDRNRLDAVLPTLRALLARGARVVLCSHLGRPDPARQTRAEMAAAYGLAPVAALLRAELGPAAFAGLAPGVVGPEVEAAVAALNPGQALLLENLRFEPGEARNDPAFAALLARLCDDYVDDAFGVVHRDQASVTGVVPLVRAAGGAALPGPLVRAELRYLHAATTAGGASGGGLRRPFGVALGGAKVRDKLPVLAALAASADVVCVGGRMAFTFLAAEGVAVGETLVEAALLPACREMVAGARARGVRFLLPRDAVVAHSLDDDAGCCTVPLTAGCCTADAPCIPAGCYGLDIGPETSAEFAAALEGCATVFWNGPMGRFEVPGFSAGTAAVARALGAATAAGATTIVGGGDSVAALNQLPPPRPPVSFVSTGGGAALELVEGRVLPGLRALAAGVAAA